MAVNRTGADRWRGVEGLARVQSVLRCVAADAPGFRAEARWLIDSGVRLAEWRSTSLRGSRTLEPDDTGVGLLVVLEGRLILQTRRQRWVAGPGTVSLVRADEANQWAVADGTHIVRVDLPRTHLAPHQRREDALPSQPLPDGPVVRAFAAALREGIGAAGAVPEAATHLCRGVEALALALLAETGPEPADDHTDLRERIIAHIEQHLGDQDLTPTSIADAFSISLRWVHQSFNRDGASVARYIRHRRVDAIAETLRADRRSARMGLLAARYGFSGREQLSRAFRSRYGVTPAAYAGMVLEDAPLPQPGEHGEEVLAG